jgi:hypothetical protein
MSIKFAFSSILTFLLCTMAMGQTLNWTLLNTGTNKNIRDISFINRDTGFIAGDNGLLKMTTDGGSTWTDLTIPLTGQGTGNNGNIKVAQFIKYNATQISGVLFFDKFTAVNRTYDLLGSPWMEECGGGLFAQYDSICSINNFHRNQIFTEYTAGGNCLEGGGSVGYFGGFCFTFDSLRSDTSFNGWMDVTSNENDQAVMVGEGGYIATNPGGFTWTVANSGMGHNYLSVDWSDTSTVYAANDDQYLPLEKSTDGGNTWSIDSTVGYTFFYPVINEMDFTDDDWGVMACQSNWTYGVIITKRGNNAADYFMTDSIMTSTYVIDSTLAFAGGLGGLLYKYEQTGGMGIDTQIEPISFSIFPNPQQVENDVLNLFSEEEINEIAVYDLAGKILLHSNINQQGNIILHTGIRNAGTYLVRIFTDKGIGTRKYIVN